MLFLSFAKHVSADGGKHVILNRTFFLLLMRKNTTTHYLTIRNQERIHPQPLGKFKRVHIAMGGLPQDRL